MSLYVISSYYTAREPQPSLGTATCLLQQKFGELEEGHFLGLVLCLLAHDNKRQSQCLSNRFKQKEFSDCSERMKMEIYPCHLRQHW